MESDRLARRVWGLFTPYRATVTLVVIAVLVSSGLKDKFVLLAQPMDAP